MAASPGAGGQRNQQHWHGPHLNAIRFVDALHGWAAGGGRILGTSNGGDTWRRQWTGRAWIEALDASDPWHAWALAPHTLLWTADGGASSHQAYVAFRTLDGGLHWRPRLTDGYLPSLPKHLTVRGTIDNYSGPFTVVDATTAYFTGSCSACSDETTSLTFTRSGGRSFSHRRFFPATYTAPFGVTFADQEHGWLLANARHRSVVLATSTGGQSWHRMLGARS